MNHAEGRPSMHFRSADCKAAEIMSTFSAQKIKCAVPSRLKNCMALEADTYEYFMELGVIRRRPFRPNGPLWVGNSIHSFTFLNLGKGRSIEGNAVPPAFRSTDIAYSKHAYKQIFSHVLAILYGPSYQLGKIRDMVQNKAADGTASWSEMIMDNNSGGLLLLTRWGLCWKWTQLIDYFEMIAKTYSPPELSLKATWFNCDSKSKINSTFCC
ncbi:hypothetical protein Ddc_02129 [Ditylenchus destructor]|nr:hypothetical protein Ddc_02129 [Ditylenchus destructor]